MLTYVLDTSAVLRALDEEAGFERVDEILMSTANGLCVAIMSAVNWGELVYTLNRRPGEKPGLEDLLRKIRRPLVIVPATEQRAVAAGFLKLKYRLAYADAFGVELATNSSAHLLVTADYGVKPAEQEIRIEFLPLKPNP